MPQRESVIERRTKETDIRVSINLDGSGSASVSTGTAFLDHMVASFAKHSMMDIEMEARSLDRIAHHLVEDAAISLGSAINKALGDRSGITRFASASVPMDESLAAAYVDLIRRPYTLVRLDISGDRIEDVSREDMVHFFESLLQNIECCIHVSVSYGTNDHHKVEAAIKSLAVAFRRACAPDSRQGGVPSTKGAM